MVLGTHAQRQQQEQRKAHDPKAVTASSGHSARQGTFRRPQAVLPAGSRWTAAPPRRTRPKVTNQGESWGSRWCPRPAASWAAGDGKQRDPQHPRPGVFSGGVHSVSIQLAVTTSTRARASVEPQQAAAPAPAIGAAASPSARTQSCWRTQNTITQQMMAGAARVGCLAVALTTQPATR